jgi:oxygen-dependent protoporphyrinogen oxidase
MHLTWSKTSDSRRTNKNLEESEKSDAEKESVYHRVVSALPEIPTCVDSEDGRSMAKFSAVSPDSAAAPRTRADMVTVMVVNLYFRTPNLLPVEGFGYLIPRSIPFEQNPERALGVVFDSDAIKGQDSPTGTKLTVMIGGHWWADWQSYPDEQEGLKMARAVVERHLGVREEPEAWKVNLQRDCIPQYHVGHEKWLRNHHTKLLRTFDGKLTVAGAICSGISVNDCVKSAYHVAHAVDNGKDRTGLEDVGERYDPTIRALDGK